MISAINPALRHKPMRTPIIFMVAVSGMFSMLLVTHSVIDASSIAIDKFRAGQIAAAVTGMAIAAITIHGRKGQTSFRFAAVLLAAGASLLHAFLGAALIAYYSTLPLRSEARDPAII